MKISSKRVFTYTCETCNTGYKKRKHAEECEKMPVEEARFEIGQIVMAKEFRTDQLKGHYKLVGYIVDILIEPPDEEYIRKWLPRQYQRLLNEHNLIYIVNVDKKKKDGPGYRACEIQKSDRHPNKYFQDKKKAREVDRILAEA